MNICFLNSIYNDTEHGGGLRTYLYLTSQEMARQKHTVTIVTGGKPKITREGKVTVVSVAELPLFVHPSQMLNPSFLIKKIHYLFVATQFILSHDFDVIEVADTGMEHILLIFLRKAPIITRLHGRLTDMKNLLFKNLMINIENVVISRSDGFTIPVKSYLRYLQKTFKIQYNDIEIIPYGISLNTQFKKIDVRSKYNLINKKIILSVGALLQPVLYERKGTDILLKVATELQQQKDIVFVVIGKIESDIDVNLPSFPKNILFLGYKNNDELHSFFETCNLLFSSARFETFGFTIVEAMAHGKPIVATKTIGIEDVMNTKCGFFFRKESAIDAKIKILKLLNNPNLAKQMGRKGKIYAQQFDIKKTTQQTLSYYKHALAIYRLKHA